MEYETLADYWKDVKPIIKELNDEKREENYELKKELNALKVSEEEWLEKSDK